ncbi:MAG TPA: undecaprenyl-phosphate glucose phosphotransferase [Bauldia sp.]|nr:undecaprenyl-phosphate glucose phosphotransferase [Bauldia sp.]
MSGADMTKQNLGSDFRSGAIAIPHPAEIAKPETALPDAGKAVEAKPAPSLNAEARAAAASLKRMPISPVLVSGFARLIEFALVAVTGFVVYVLYVEQDAQLDFWYSVPVVAAALLSVGFIQMAGGYQIAALRGTGPQLVRVFAAWTLVFALIAVGVFLAKVGETFSRVWFATWFLTGFAALALFRVALAGRVRAWTREGLLERRAVIVGGGPSAEQLIQALEAQPDNDVRICGIFDDRKDERSPASVAGYRKLGTVAELIEFGRMARVDLLIVSLPITAENRLLQILKQLWVLPVDIRLSAHTNKLRFRPRTYSFVGKVPFLDVVDKPIADWDVVAKWLVDRVLGAFLLLLALPVMALVALAVRLDSKGPVLFKQKRYGFNNELIEVYKFRSMYTDMTDANAAKLVTKGDPRVTRVGRIIRKTSLDELPQLFNVVFKGNLSLVGPRPHAVQAKAADRLYDEVVDGYFARHRVKPGITGWAQINGWRGETDTPEKIQHRVEHDLYYIENWSALFDLYIVAMTPIRLLSKTENAY